MYPACTSTDKGMAQDNFKLDLKVKTLEAAILRSQQNGDAYTYSESQGRGKGSLRVIVRNGKAQFYFRYWSASKKSVDFALGFYDKNATSEAAPLGRLTVSAARHLAAQAVIENEMALSEGFDGLKEYKRYKSQKHAEAREAEALELAKQRQLDLDKAKYTLRALLDLYVVIKTEAGVGSARDMLNLFRNYVYDTSYAGMPANEINAKDIAAIVRVAREKTTRQWQKLRAYIQAAYNLAVNADEDETADSRFIPFGVNHVPVSKPKKPGTLSTAVRDRALSEVELRHVLLSLRADDCYKADLLRLVILTGQRMEQFLRVPLKDLDLDANILVLRDKKGKRTLPKTHYLYLEGEALEIVRSSAEASEFAGSKYVFSYDAKEYVKQGTLSKYSKKLSDRLVSEGKLKEPFKAMDIRTTVATEMSRIRITDDVKKRIFSHGSSDVHNKHYNKYSYEDDIRRAYRRWGAELSRIESCRSEDVVVPIR